MSSTGTLPPPPSREPAFERFREWLRSLLGARDQASSAVMAPAAKSTAKDAIQLLHFHEILVDEHAAIKQRRNAIAKKEKGAADGPTDVMQLRPKPSTPADGPTTKHGPVLPQSKVIPLPDLERVTPNYDRLKGSIPGSSKPSASGDTPKGDPKDPSLDPTRSRPLMHDTIGLSLSGGGIRSASVCLGAMQALNAKGAFNRISYLSTVSGGGYIGAATVAGMNKTGGEFPFGQDNDVRDTRSVGHIRNYSNYLMPRGYSFLHNATEALVVIARGLLANAVFVTAGLLALALITAYAFPAYTDLKHGSFLIRLVDRLLGYAHIGPIVTDTPGWLAQAWALSIVMVGLLALLLLLWAWRCSRTTHRAGDVGSRSIVIARRVAYATAAVALLDAVPWLIQMLGDAYDYLETSPGVRRALPTGLITTAVSIAAFASKIANFLKTTAHAPGLWTILRRGLARVALIFAALIVPAFLVFVFLHITAWFMPDAMPYHDYQSTIPLLWGWLALLLLVILAATYRPNAYSLNRFYRDRLSQAFLFDPTTFPPPVRAEAAASGPRASRSSGPTPLNELRLSKLDSAASPYLLINAAMNLQGSREANGRGRHADFFIMSKLYTGSELSRYISTGGNVATRTMEDIDPRFDLATAIATSGAAISSNMGSQTNGLLAPTLALLNVRLGYWLPNPIAIMKRSARLKAMSQDVIDTLRTPLFLWKEMTGQIHEGSDYIYLTDGGHIENLGIYELLRRGCQLIIAIDAEADPEFAFPSLVRLERHARIDLGVRIDLPRQAITDVSQKVSAAFRGEATAPPNPAGHGPHAAIGRIYYPALDDQPGAVGTLLYIKSSLSGDERDYILDYKRRNPDFPHETTGDQFFSEEQLEVYRALGFHMLARVIDGRDGVAWNDEGEGAWLSARDAIDEVRRLLKLPALV